MNTNSDEYKPHRNLITFRRLDNTEYTSDYSSLRDNQSVNDTQSRIKYEKQKEKICSLKRQIQNASTQQDINALKNSIYEELNAINNTILSLTEQNRMIEEENYDLKENIDKKDNVIEEFQEIAKVSNEKFQKLSTINDNLKSDLENANVSIRNNAKLKNENAELLQSLNEIKEQLNSIEENYNKTMHSNQVEISSLNNEVLQLKEKNECLTKQSQNTENDIQNEKAMLNEQIQCLLKEKEQLMREKEETHKEIIGYQQAYYMNNNNSEMNRIRVKRHREEDMISLFNKKEEGYIRTITQLQNTIAQREKEIESIKDQMLRAVHDLKLENEKLRYYIDLILKRKPTPKKENDYIC